MLMCLAAEDLLYIDFEGIQWQTQTAQGAYNHGLLDKEQAFALCGECKYWSKTDEVDGVRYGECKHPKGAIKQGVFLRDSFYCADGERKEL